MLKVAFALNAEETILACDHLTTGEKDAVLTAIDYALALYAKGRDALDADLFKDMATAREKVKTLPAAE